MLTKEEKNILDAAWSEAVKERDEYIDVWDKKSNGTDAHHIFVRGSSLINRYDVCNGITLSRKNHGLAECEKNEEFEAFIKDRLGTIYDKLQGQKSIVGVPLEYEAMFFADFFNTKQQELEDYYKFNGVQLAEKKDLIFVLENSNAQGKMLEIKPGSVMYDRVTIYMETLCIKIKKIKKFLFCLSNRREIFFMLDVGQPVPISLFSLFIYELLRKEIVDVFQCIY